MQSALFSLVLAITVAFVGFVGVVPEPMAGVVQVAFFSLLVVFVVLMVRYLVHDR